MLRKDSPKGPKVYIPHIECERRSHIQREIRIVEGEG